MKIGTRSILFGVHQFFWHPFTVGLAWRKLYTVWPTPGEWLAIIFHDVGYWGCDDIDGPSGKLHPFLGAIIAGRLAAKIGYEEYVIRNLSMFHSRSYAQAFAASPSLLCWADKVSIVFEPRWFYLLRGTLSGEIAEFKQVAVDSGRLLPSVTHGEWFDWYRNQVLNNPDICELIAYTEL